MKVGVRAQRVLATAQLGEERISKQRLAQITPWGPMRGRSGHRRRSSAAVQILPVVRVFPLISPLAPAEPACDAR